MTQGNITRPLAEAALRMQAPELAPFVDWLRAERMARLEQLVAAPQDRVAQMQGEARCLGRILELVESAPRLLEKLSG